MNIELCGDFSAELAPNIRNLNIQKLSSNNPPVSNHKYDFS